MNNGQFKINIIFIIIIIGLISCIISIHNTQNNILDREIKRACIEINNIATNNPSLIRFIEDNDRNTCKDLGIILLTTEGNYIVTKS
jgi:hypothetical protein